MLHVVCFIGWPDVHVPCSLYHEFVGVITVSFTIPPIPCESFIKRWSLNPSSSVDLSNLILAVFAETNIYEAATKFQRGEGLTVSLGLRRSSFLTTPPSSAAVSTVHTYGGMPHGHAKKIGSKGSKLMIPHGVLLWNHVAFGLLVYSSKICRSAARGGS